MRSVSPRQQDRIDRILECTRQQVARLGYDGVNMRELATEADVSTATLYNLFNSKDELILAASQDLLADINRLAEEGGRGIQRLIRRLDAVAETIVSNPNYADAMGRMLFAADASAPIVQQLMAQSAAIYESNLTEMLQDGELVEGLNLERLARDLTGASWSVNLLWMKGFIALHDFREQYVAACLSVLLPWLTPELQERYRDQTGLTG